MAPLETARMSPSPYDGLAQLRARLLGVIGAGLRSSEGRLVLRLRAPLVGRTASALLELAAGQRHRRGRLQIALPLSMAERAEEESYELH